MPRFEMASGNKMVAQAAIDAGCRFFAGYPITPSSEIYSEMMRRLSEGTGLAVGTPDEISALSYAIGASMAGTMSMTATSGPGWSLMVETAQYALMTETPVVIAIVQRLGPATGGATQNAQGDVLFVEYANSGGYPIPVFAPSDALSSYQLTLDAFEWAEKLRSPVILLSDKEVATTLESVDLDKLERRRVSSRVLANKENYSPYGISNVEDIPSFARVGGNLPVTMTGSAHNAEGQLRKNDPETLRQLEHLHEKIMHRAEEMESVRWVRGKGSETLLVSYGISARTCRQALRDLDREGKAADLLEIQSLYPVPLHALEEAGENYKKIIVVEENRTGLYAKEIRSTLHRGDLWQVNSVGMPITPGQIADEVLR